MKETSSDASKNSTASAEVGLLAGMGQRFLDFCDRFRGHFRQQTRTVRRRLSGMFRD